MLRPKGEYTITGFRLIEYGNELPSVSIMRGGIGHNFIKLSVSSKRCGHSFSSLIEFRGDANNEE